MSRKKTKICLACGKDFLGNEGAFTCGDACRSYMSRNLAKGKKPEYYFIAKGKGQKVPILDKVTVPQKPKKNLPKVSVPELSPPEEKKETIVLTKEQGILKVAELMGEIRIIETEKCPMNKHPKIFVLEQEMKKSELEDKINILNTL